MKSVTVIAITTRAPAFVVKQEQEYASRLGFFRLQVKQIRPSSPEKETAAVLRHISSGTDLYLLDASGRLYDSDSFAGWLRGRLELKSGLVLVIGGASGLPAPLIAHATGLLSLSSLTMAHNMARLVLAEQLFRADCMMRGHPYPK